MTWNVENRPISVNTSPATSFVYDGDGKRVKKTEGGQTTVYANKYYEKNLVLSLPNGLTTGDITLYYYLGDRMVALKKGTTLRYVSQDHLTGTSVTSDTSGNLVATIKYFPFGDRRNSTGIIDTEKQFTGQRLDAGTGLYYYGARYYDAGIGRFISADPIVARPSNPQALNRYSYVVNNPSRYIDPSGMVNFSPAPDPPSNVISEPPWGIGIGETTTTTSSATADTPSGTVTITKETSTTTWPTTPAGTVTVTTSVTTIATSGSTVTTIIQTTTDPEGESTVGISPNPGSLLQTAVNASPQTAVYTTPAFIFGATSANPIAGPNNTIIFQASPGSPVDTFLSSRKTSEDATAGAMTLGHVILSVGDIAPRDLAHELEHVRQYNALGVKFMPIYGIFHLIYGYLDNPLEVQARKAAGQE